MTAAYTSLSGTPFSRAARAQSSYSGVTISNPSRRPRFARTGPHGVYTVTPSRVNFDRCAVVRRTPNVPVSRNRIVSNTVSALSEASTLNSTPGRFFFIWIGVANTSSAPAANS